MFLFSNIDNVDCINLGIIKSKDCFSNFFLKEQLPKMGNSNIVVLRYRERPERLSCVIC